MGHETVSGRPGSLRPAPPASTDEPGLTSAEAAAHLARDGPNVLPVAPPPPRWQALLTQLVHFFALMLWAAAGLAALAGLPQLSIAIVLVILANGTFPFFQEYRAERAARSLRDLLPRRVLVFRDGVMDEVDVATLVEGDLVRLTSGDRIPADLRLTSAHAALIDVSTLTGESVPNAAEAGDLVHAGSFLVEGEADGVVEATGSKTRLAECDDQQGRCRHPVRQGPKVPPKVPCGGPEGPSERGRSPLAPTVPSGQGLRHRPHRREGGT